LLLRFGAATALIISGADGLVGNLDESIRLAMRLVSVSGGVLMLVGLWTPVVGVVVALAELWSAYSVRLSHADDLWIHLLLAVLAAAVAMLGPGAWSIDARLFGRRRFDIDSRKRGK